MKIIILPGLDGTDTLRRDFCDALAPQIDAKCLSYPVDVTTYADLLPMVQSQLSKVEGNYILVAESFSGPLALQITASKPANLKAVIFIVSFPSSPRTLPSILGKITAWMPPTFWGIRHIIDWFGFGKWGSPDLSQSLLQVLKAVPPTVLAQRLEQVLQCNEVARLQNSSIPMFSIEASHDRLVSGRACNEFPNAGVETCHVEGPHFLLQARPNNVARQVLLFCSRLGL